MRKYLFAIKATPQGVALEMKEIGMRTCSKEHEF